MNQTNKLNAIFKILSFHDNIRWQSVSNYNLINYYRNDLSDDTKLLTHWLCYITDRQMAFERIWDIGGFILSELVDTFTKEKNLDMLNPNNSPTFFIYDNNGYQFRSVSKCGNNRILKKYDVQESENPTFSSRYYPSDYYSILCSLSFLAKYDFSFTKFVANCLRQHEDEMDLIPRVVFSLYLMSYNDIGQPTKNDIVDFHKNLMKAEQNNEKVLAIINDDKRFETNYRYFNKYKKYSQKRAWCGLRDYFKSPEFKNYFMNSLRDYGFTDDDFRRMFSYEVLQQFELPGDVWNNNSIFRNCILEGTEYQKEKQPLNRILRDYFNKNKDELIDCYPEQFDITFDFVPRMCTKNNCSICPIGFLKGKKSSHFKKICVKNDELFCPVALIDCNYITNCHGQECNLLKVLG